MEHRAVGGGYNNNNNRRRRRRFSRVPRRLLGRMEEEEDKDDGDFGMVGLFFLHVKNRNRHANKDLRARVESYKEAYGCHEYQSKEKRKERARILQYIFSFGMASQSRYLKANN